jgi:hypothetical protein
MDETDVATHLRAGAALYTDGYYHAAHDPWEAAWLAVREASPDDAALLQGLIQTTAAVHHARSGNAEGATGLAGSAREYLRAVPAGHRAVDLAPLRSFLDVLALDDSALDPPVEPPPLRVEGRELTLADLEFPAAAATTPPLAETEGFDPGPAERAVEYAWADLEGSPTSRFVDAVLAFVSTDGASAPRAVAYDRLRGLVERRAAEESDVAGLFD